MSRDPQEVVDESLFLGLDGVQIGAPERVEIDRLVIQDFVRYGGEDASHARVLAAVDVRWPPIFVHRASMTVVDGVHRVCGALRRGESEIDARFLDGSMADTFIVAVRANTGSGKPLTLAERERSALRIIGSHPHWSDRAIAEACGLSGKTVGKLRERSTEEVSQLNTRRIGRDGRSRPVDPRDSRRRAAELLQRSPDSSLREIARQVGVSPSTVKNVRDRLERDNVALAADAASASLTMSVPPTDPGTGVADGAATTGRRRPPLHTVLTDPALQSIESGQEFASWFAAHLVQPGECNPYVVQVPTARASEVAAEARAFAAEWLRFADALEARTKRRRAG